MPNGCNNCQGLGQDNPEQITRVIEAAQADRLMSEFVPCPQPLMDAAEGWTSDAVAQAKMDALRNANLAAYGFASWYDWSIANWGCKWDVNDVVVDRNDANHVHLTFDSAWSPPIEFYEKLEVLGFIVEAYWYEPGMMFCGLREDCCNDEYNIQGDSDWVIRHIPRGIDQTMGISVSMAEQEAEAE